MEYPNISRNLHCCRPERSLGNLGTGKDLVFNEMKADDFRQVLFFVKMAFDRVQDVEFQLLFGVAFGENGMAQGLGIEAAIQILFDRKYNFLHGQASIF
jgi:hypothetical protein